MPPKEHWNMGKGTKHMSQPLTSESDDGAVRRCPSEIERLYYGRHRMTLRIGTYLALIRMMGIAHLVESLYGHTKLVSETHARLSRTRQTLVDLRFSGMEML